MSRKVFGTSFLYRVDFKNILNFKCSFKYPLAPNGTSSSLLPFLTLHATLSFILFYFEFYGQKFKKSLMSLLNIPQYGKTFSEAKCLLIFLLGTQVSISVIIEISRENAGAYNRFKLLKIFHPIMHNCAAKSLFYDFPNFVKSCQES